MATSDCWNNFCWHWGNNINMQLCVQLQRFQLWDTVTHTHTHTRYYNRRKGEKLQDANISATLCFVCNQRAASSAQILHPLPVTLLLTLWSIYLQMDNHCKTLPLISSLWETADPTLLTLPSTGHFLSLNQSVEKKTNTRRSSESDHNTDVRQHSSSSDILRG